MLAFLVLCVLYGVLLGRIVRPWLMGGILAGPLACATFFVTIFLTGHIDQFWIISFVVSLGFSFVITLPLSFVGFLWRQWVIKSHAAQLRETG